MSLGVREVTMDGRRYSCDLWSDWIELEGAQALATFADGCASAASGAFMLPPPSARRSRHPAAPLLAVGGAQGDPAQTEGLK